jgi:hypothetical protein
MDKGLPVGVAHNVPRRLFLHVRAQGSGDSWIDSKFRLASIRSGGSRPSHDEGRSWGSLGRALSQNPCDVFGNGNRDDGNCDGNSYLLDDGHAENGSTAGRPGRHPEDQSRSCTKGRNDKLKIAAFIDTSMKPTGLCTLSTDAPASESRGPDAPSMFASYYWEPMLVDVVVKVTAARAGQIAPATENSVAEPAPPTAETSAGSFFQSTEGNAAKQGRRMVWLPSKTLHES